jgi:steroid delta-isomerase-like uncharacterized protein
MGAALDTAQRFYAALAAGDFAGLTACFSADCPTVTPAGTMDPAQHEAFIRATKSALPDAHMAVDKAVEAGNEVFIAGRFQGTHQGDFVTPQGTMPASGKALVLPFADYFRVEDGTIVEHQVFWDQASMMGQLGAGGPG